MTLFATTLLISIVFVTLWFYLSQNKLYEKKRTVESAKAQLNSCLNDYIRTCDNIETEKSRAILDISHDIYKQSVQLYNDAIQKPWHAIPAFFLGFNHFTDSEML